MVINAGLTLPAKYQDPVHLTKAKEWTDLDILRFLPVEPRIPAGFWDPTWCYYGVAVGQHVRFPEDRGLFFWHIAFLHSPGNRECSDGRFEEPVTQILKEFCSKVGGGFFVKERGDLPSPRSNTEDPRPWAYLHCLKRYHVKEHPKFEPNEIASGLFQLVEWTYPRFLALQAPAKPDADAP